MISDKKEYSEQDIYNFFKNWETEFRDPGKKHKFATEKEHKKMPVDEYAKKVTKEFVKYTS